MLTLPNISTTGHAQTLAVTVKPQSVRPSVPRHVRQPAGRLREWQHWPGGLPTQYQGFSHVVKVQPRSKWYCMEIRIYLNNLLASEISSINLSQVEKFIQMLALHICFHMMVVSTVVRVLPSMILACFSHLSD